MKSHKEPKLKRFARSLVWFASLRSLPNKPGEVTKRFMKDPESAQQLKDLRSHHFNDRVN